MVGLNCIENRMRSITNVVDKKWVELPIKNYRLQCKIRGIHWHQCNHLTLKNFVITLNVVVIVLSQQSINQSNKTQNVHFYKKKPIAKVV